MPLSKKTTFLALAITLLCSVVLGQSKPKQYTVKHFDHPYMKFYSKYMDCDGIAIRSGDVVDDKAFFVAAQKIDLLLKNLPSARQNLVYYGSELHIIGKDQQTSDLPEFTDRKGVQYMDNGMLTDIDKRTRGMGGIVASCGEENLLHLPGDRYGDGYDICLHEFSHTLMNFGLDSLLRLKIVAQYHSAIAQGLWKGAYAATNPDEYWAELTMWYMGYHGDMMPGKKPAPGQQALLNYDPKGYALLDSIYSGKLQPATLPLKSRSVNAGTPSGGADKLAKLVVNNKSVRQVKVSWVDQAGNLKLFATITPSGHYEHASYYSHVWLVDDGQTPFYIQIFTPLCEIGITK